MSPSAYLSRIIAVDHRAILAVNAVAQHYAYLVKAFRPAHRGPYVDVTDMAPRIRNAHDLRQFKPQVEAVYRRLNNVRMTARALDCTEALMEAFLASEGLKEAGRPTTYRRHATGPAEAA